MSDNFPFEHFINFDKSNNNNNLHNKQIVDTLSKNDSNESFLANSFGKVELNQQVTDEDFNFEELKSITDEILNILKDSITPRKFNAFFQNTFTVHSIDEDVLEFSVTTNFIKNMMENHYLEHIKQAVTALLGKQYLIKISVMNSTKSLSSNENNVLNTVNEHKQVSYTEEILNKDLNTDINFKRGETVNDMSFTINSSFTSSTDEIINEVKSQEIKHLKDKIYGKIDPYKSFDNFIVGHSNNMAHAFSLAVSKDPGKIYPQLYLYGNSGLGKTHLLHAICNYIQDKDPGKRICLTSAADFTKEMVMAIQSKKINEFQRKYTEQVDVLIIDDIHELKNRPRTQQEFFDIFNELQNRNKQLVFTSDKPPKDISGIEDRIRTRLSSALLIDIQQPDLETRCAILRKKAIERDIFISDDVINLIASCVRSNVRELEGKLIKLGAYSDLMNVDIDLEIAKEQLGLTQDFEEKILTIESITKAVASYFKLPLGDIRGKARKAELVFARHIAMYMTHKILKKTLEEIGDFFDKRDHSTVIHAIDKIKKRIKEDSKVSQQIYEIESTL